MKGVAFSLSDFFLPIFIFGLHSSFCCLGFAQDFTSIYVLTTREYFV